MSVFLAGLVIGYIAMGAAVSLARAHLNDYHITPEAIFRDVYMWPVALYNLYKGRPW